MRRAIGPPGTVPATPVAQKTFEIFVEEEQPVVEEKPKRAMGSVIAQELDGDPDYQSLFGFFDDRSKADLQLSVKENLHTATKWTECALPEIEHTSETHADGFEIYDENHSKPPQPPKTRLAIKKAVRSASMEEAYAQRVGLQERKNNA